MPRLSPPRGLEGQAISNAAWALATARYESPRLFSALAQAAAANIDRLGALDLSNLAWAFAWSSQVPVAEHPALYSRLGPAALVRLGDFDGGSLSNLAWALAVASPSPDVLDAVATAALSERLAEVHGSTALNVGQLCQVHQYQLWLEERGDVAEEALPEALRQQARDSFLGMAQLAPSSRMQRLVARELRAVGGVRSVEEEVVVAQGYTVDLLVQHADFGPLAVEVDGPHHFLSEGSRRPTGATQLKRRQLRSSGLRLVSLPYWELNELQAKPRRGRDDLRACSASTSSPCGPSPGHLHGATGSGQWSTLLERAVRDDQRVESADDP